MKDKLKALETLFEETGSTLKRDIDRCKSLHRDFVKQILEESEFLSLDVVHVKLEIPKLNWLEESLQIRGVDYATKQFVPGVLPEDAGSNGVAEGTEKRSFNVGPDLTPQDDTENEKDYSVLMSEKCVQTTPLHRGRTSLGKRSLLKFLQKSKILKKGDEIHFVGDKSYDADISHAVDDLTSANSSTTNDDCTLYPDSSYDGFSSSPAQTTLSSISKVSNSLQDELISSSTDGSTIVETPMFKRVRANRQSLVSFLLPKRGNEGDGGEILQKELSVCDQNKSSEMSMHPSISLLANAESSLDFTSEPNESVALQESMNESVEETQHIKSKNSNIGQHGIEMQSELEESEARHSNFEFPSVEYHEGSSNEGPEKIEIVEEQNETQEIVKEAPRDNSAEINGEIMELESDGVDYQAKRCADQLDDTSLLKKVDTPMSEMPSDSIYSGEIGNIHTAQKEQYDMVDIEANINDNSEATKNDTNAHLMETDAVNDGPAKLRIRRKRRRCPPLVMPKYYRPPRKDFIAVLNETRTRTSKSLFYQSSIFRKEPLSVGLKRVKETPCYQSALKGKILTKKEDCISKQRSPLFPPNGNTVSSDKGFEIIQRIEWTPQITHVDAPSRITKLGEDLNNGSSLAIIDESKHVTDIEERTSPTSGYPSEKSQDEIIMSVKPKRARQEEPYTVDLALEITVHNKGTSSQTNGETSSRKQRDVTLRVREGKLRGKGLTNALGPVPEVNSFDKTGSEVSRSRLQTALRSVTDFGDVTVVCNSTRKRQKKKRGRPAKQKNLSDDLKGTRTTEVTVLDGQAEANSRAFDTDDNAKSRTEDLGVTIYGRKMSRCDTSVPRVTRSSQKVLRDSTKKFRKEKRLNSSNNAKNRAVKNVKSNIKVKEEDRKVPMHEEVKKSNKRKANGSRGTDGKLSAKQGTDGKEITHSNAKNQKAVSDEDQLCDDIKDDVFVDTSNESIASSKPSRARKKPGFYTSIDSHHLDLSVSLKRSPEKSKVKSGKKSKAKSNGKLLGKLEKESKVNMEGKVETIAAAKEIEPRKHRRKRVEKPESLKDEFRMASIVDNGSEKDEVNGGKDACEGRGDELIAENQSCNDKDTAANSKRTEKRGRKVSMAPLLVLINESDESSKVFENSSSICQKLDLDANGVTEKSNGVENLVGAEAADGKGENSDTEAVSQGRGGNISRGRKYRGRTRNETKSAKKHGRKHTSSEAIGIEAAGCKKPVKADDDGHVEKVVDAKNQDVKEINNKVSALSGNDDNAVTVEKGARESGPETVSCDSNISDVKVVDALDKSVQGGGKPARSGRKGGRGAKSGAKVGSTWNRKGGRTKGRRVAKIVEKGGRDEATLTVMCEREQRLQEDVSNNLGSESHEQKSTESIALVAEGACAAKEDSVHLTSLKTPDLRRSTRKVKNQITASVEKENKFVAPKAVKTISVKNQPAVNKRSVCGEKDNAIPEKKRRALFSKKNTSLMSLNFSVMQDTTAMNGTQNTTMNTNSIVMPQTLSNFLRSFVAPKVKKKSS